MTRQIIYLLSSLLLLFFPAVCPSQETGQRLGGVCFSPIRDHESPARGIHSLPSAIEQDVATASKLARSIRTYTLQSSSYLIPEFCRDHDIGCVVGAWIGPARWQNDAQIERLIQLCQDGNPAIKAVIIGNEVLHRGDCDETELIHYVRAAAAKIDLPIAVADTWTSWIKHPDLAAAVDILGVQIYPYWEGLPIDGAAKYTVDRLREVQTAYPGKRIVLTEFGWPTAGERLGAAVPSPQNAARYLREILPLLDDAGIEYYYFAVWDEKWKVGPEGGVGAHWGLFQSDGTIKPAMTSVLPTQVHAGSSRPARMVQFTLTADQPRNQQVSAVAIGVNGPDDSDAAKIAGASLESQRGAGLQNAAPTQAIRGSYGALRPIQVPTDNEADGKTNGSEQLNAPEPGAGNDGASRRLEPSVTYVSTPLDHQSTDRTGEAESIHGICLSLFRDNESPHLGITPLIAEIRQDVAFAKRLADAVRTYSVTDNFAFVPQICDSLGVDCLAGAALGKNPWLNELELEMLIRIGRNPGTHLKAVIVGNEVLHRGDFSPQQYVQYIRRVKQQVKVPVATAELLHSWMQHPELADEVDILGVQIYPYWGGVRIEDAAINTIESVRELQRRFPDKPVILTEFGWPTSGGNLGAAEASPENAAKYFREVIPMLEDNGIEYFYFAMTDENWKLQDEGGPGAHWGLLQADGTVKESLKDLIPAPAAAGLSRPPRKLQGVPF